MTCGQSNAARRKAILDPRYQRSMPIEAAQKRLARQIEREKAMKSRKSITSKGSR